MINTLSAAPSEPMLFRELERNEVATPPAQVIDINKPDDSPWPSSVFAGLPLFAYDFIMYDPPWHFATHSDKGQSKGAARQYRTWTLRKIRTLPLGQLASRDAVLFLWATSPLLLDVDRPSRSPVGEVIEALGFRYGAFGGWAKKTINDKQRFGTGYVMRSVMERQNVEGEADDTTSAARRICPLDAG